MTDSNRHRQIGKRLSVFVNDSQLAAIAQELAATEKDVEKAMKRAINRTIMWMKTRAKRALSKGMNIPSKVILSRLRHASYNASKGTARLWLGLNPVSAVRLKPRKNKKGVVAGGELFPGAFITTGRNGNRHVYRREGKSRLPIESVYKDIQAGQDIFETEIFEGWEAFLYQRFEHELKWQSRKR